MLKRIDEHIEFHGAIHKSDVAFLKAVKLYVTDLKQELSNWVCQYGCTCKHPACSRCRDTKAAKELLDS